MERIKTERVKKIIHSCQYYLEADVQSLFRDDVRYLI